MNVKQKNPYPPKRQNDVRRGKMSMDVTPYHYYMRHFESKVTVIKVHNLKPR